MRIISGKYKSRRIQVPANFKARPTTDFAKENLFNILNNRLDWDETTALDLFSGTGSIALELVSRGCPRVVAVESDSLHYQFINKAVATLNAQEMSVLRADVFRFLQSCNSTFDFIFADPPYNLPNLKTVPALILEKQLLKPDGIFVMEHSREHDFSQLPLFAELRQYGSVHFSIFENR
ncbi:MAG: 16S rRNA (guanine(966)-N(2))-methyltransferase RsmD [Dysgonamonadaceae bacterium]|jgi:16S rRNA (guanine(966)-N(2))-methyltransferase RsmD|nr:16S rRNA (guanine(966)-N(2))-methyltransferase RsmD [Dysgonamonadaceae bacterium]